MEESSSFNGLLLKGAGMMHDIKAKVVEKCPQAMSCVDVMALTMNEVMTLAGLPPQRPLGCRRDSLLSLADIVEADNLPVPTWTMD